MYKIKEEEAEDCPRVYDCTLCSNIKISDKMTNKIYIGDGVYAEKTENGISLTTEDGISVCDSIFLEWNVFDILCKWISND